jgi:hypothetical protein
MCSKLVEIYTESKPLVVYDETHELQTIQNSHWI